MSRLRTCLYCGRADEESPLVALASGSICADCTRAAREVRDGFTVARDDDTACISCGAGPQRATAGDVRGRAAAVLAGAPLRRKLVVKVGAAICTDCLGLCSRIVP